MEGGGLELGAWVGFWRGGEIWRGDEYGGDFGAD